MGKITETEKKRRQYRARKPSLRIAGVEFTPTPGVERRLARVYELLLTRKIKESQTNKDELISQESLED